MKQVTPKMIYNRWLAALRSGEYQQAQGCLRECRYSDYDYDRDIPVIKEVVGFCCLGVLQDLAAKDGGDQWNVGRGACDDDELPEQKILDFMGLDRDMLTHLIDLNDEKNAGFEEIADVIEFEIMPATGN